MGAKTAIETRFSELCNAIEPFDTWAFERRNGGAAFLLSVGERQTVEVHATWEKLVEMISNPEALDGFLSSELTGNEEQDEVEESDDPFSSDELIIDRVGRVHFAADLPDE